MTMWPGRRRRVVVFRIGTEESARLVETRPRTFGDGHEDHETLNGLQLQFESTERVNRLSLHGFSGITIPGRHSKSYLAQPARMKQVGTAEMPAISLILQDKQARQRRRPGLTCAHELGALRHVCLNGGPGNENASVQAP